MYSMSRFHGDPLLFSRIGKVLPAEIGRDTGVLGESCKSIGKPPLPVVNRVKRSSSPSSSSVESVEDSHSRRNVTHTHIIQQPMQIQNESSHDNEARIERKIEFDMSLAICNSTSNEFLTVDMKKRAQEAIIRLQEDSAKRNRSVTPRKLNVILSPASPGPFDSPVNSFPCNQRCCSCPNYEGFQTDEFCRNCMHASETHGVFNV